MPDVLAEVDVVVTTTSAAHYVVTYDAVKAARKKRRGRSLFLIDLAVPRDVDPRVDTLDGVFLYNVDDLSQIVAQTLSSRQKEATRAEQIVEEEARTFERGMSAQQVTPVVVALRRRVENTLQAELDRSLRTRLKHLNEADRDALGRMMEAAVNKLLHSPTRRLRALATDEEKAYELEASVSLVADLFELEKDSMSLSPSRMTNAVPLKDEVLTDPDASSVVPRVTRNVS